MMEDNKLQAVSDWWQTDIIDMEPGKIHFHGQPIENLIGQLSFSQMIWFMLKSEKPTQTQTLLLDAVLMSAVDHGPQAPSIAIARMAASCGVGINNAMASAINSLGDVHGGAGEQALELYLNVKLLIEQGMNLESAVTQVLDIFRRDYGKYIPGFGHRFHPVDPRSVKLKQLVQMQIDAGSITGQFLTISEEMEDQIQIGKSKPVPLNIDGATAIIYGELGFEPELARGLFCLSRSVGILAHAWEEMNSGKRNKGPMPKGMLWSYTGK